MGFHNSRLALDSREALQKKSGNAYNMGSSAFAFCSRACGGRQAPVARCAFGCSGAPYRGGSPRLSRPSRAGASKGHRVTVLPRRRPPPKGGFVRVRGEADVRKRARRRRDGAPASARPLTSSSGIKNAPSRQPLATMGNHGRPGFRSKKTVRGRNDKV